MPQSTAMWPDEGGDPTRRLLIFDCDGVLVDSEPISIAVLMETIRKVGAEIPIEEAYKRFLGRSVGAMVEDLAHENGLSLTSLHLADMRKRLYDQFRRDLKPVDGVAEAIARLDRPFCVASSSQPERIRLSLEVTGLLASFDPDIYSASMVERGKPAPDLFLHTARALAVAPRNCVVVEDSPAGILAARRAGMRVLAFTGGSHFGPADLAPAIEVLEPDAIFGSMLDLPWILDRLDGRKQAS